MSDTTISAKTLRSMDNVIRDFKKEKVSDQVDLQSAFSTAINGWADKKERILNTFHGLPVTDQIFFVASDNASDRTAFMADVLADLREGEDWLVLVCSSASDINEGICADLEKELAIKATSGSMISRINDCLIEADRRHMRVLVFVDDVADTQPMRAFAHVFQMEISRNRPLYFIGAGTEKDINELSSEKDVAFLYRVPKIKL